MISYRVSEAAGRLLLAAAVIYVLWNLLFNKTFRYAVLLLVFLATIFVFCICGLVQYFENSAAKKNAKKIRQERIDEVKKRNREFEKNDYLRLLTTPCACGCGCKPKSSSNLPGLPRTTPIPISNTLPYNENYAEFLELMKKKPIYVAPLSIL